MNHSPKKTVIVLIAMLGAASIGNSQVLVDETFTYADGSLASVSGGAWTEFSGTGGQTIVSGALSLDDNFSGDNERSFAEQSSGTVFYSLKFNALSSDQPSSTTDGGYFIGFNSGSTFYSRLVAYRPSGSTAGTFTLGVTSHSSGTTTDWGAELLLDSTYSLVVSLNLSTGDSTLWIDPASSSSASVVSTGVGPISAVDSIGTRISGTSNGDKTIDDLVVGLKFSDVSGAAVPEPSAYSVVFAGLIFARVISRRRRIDAV